jgi:hypothetical protein
VDDVSLRRLLLALLLLPLLALLAVWVDPTRVLYGRLRGEAFYRGRPTSYWKAELIDGQVSCAGPYADVPHWVQRAPSGWAELIGRTTGSTPLSWPDVTPLLQRDPAAAPVLIDLLHDGDPGVRLFAAFVLENLGEQANVAAPALVSALEDPHEGVRRRAAFALKRIDPTPPPAGVPAD